MAYSVNSSPLINSQFDSENEEEGNDIYIQDNKPLLTNLEPNDKFYATYFIFYLLGIVSLLPWNFFITADDYWMYKFRNVSSNISIREETPQRNSLQTEFTSLLNLASCYPNLLFLILNTIISQRISLNVRVQGSLIIMLVLMMITLIFVNLNTDSWQTTFFWLTILTSILLNSVSPIFGGSITGIVGKFSPIYITAVVGGQALGGIFAAVTQIAALAIGASSTHTALVYFVIGNLTIVLAIILYIFLTKSAFFNFHLTDQSVISNLNIQSESLQSAIVSYKGIIRKMWLYGFCVFFNFVVTISMYPGVTVLIESQGKGHGNRWNDIYFVPTVAYLLFNVGDYTGRIIAGRILRPKSITVITILSISRLIFVPLLLLCNCQPRHHLAVVFDQDWEYIVIIVLFAFTNGYMFNIISVMVPRIVGHYEKEVASLLVIVFLAAGSALGSTISLFMIRLI